ncbi:MAG: hypothetical protein M9887_04135 [Chitinophagales bacterium]|nr:hypothetical protein [Chitinophagales bacterium]
MIFLLGNSNAFSRVYTTCPYPQNEFGFSYGYNSIDQMAIGVGNTFASIFNKSIFKRDYQNEKISLIGPVAFNYKYFFHWKLSVGTSIIYSYTGVNYTTSDNKAYKDKYHTISLMPRFDFYYIRNPKFAMYGLLGAGVSVIDSRYQATNENHLGVALTFQLTPIAVRIGRDFGLTIELGVGNLGIANGGFSYRKYDRPWTGF